MKPTAVVVGGTSGLGLELAGQLRDTHEVWITGQKNPKVEELRFAYFNLNPDDRDEFFLPGSLAGKNVDLFVYAAGFYQEGTLGELDPDQVEEMINVGLMSPAQLVSDILGDRESLPGFIAITSTSQFTPRKLEPVYTAVKAGLGMLAQSVSLDPKVGKVLVAAPAGMKTPFWASRADLPDDYDTYLDPAWVAKKILEVFAEPYDYRLAKILRDPARVEIIETRTDKVDEK